MKLTKGLNTDVQPTDQPEGSYRDARNMLFSRKYNSFSNEDGFDELFDLPAQPIGVIALNNDDWCVFIAAGAYDEIGLVSNNTYTRILKTTSSTDRLNLSQDHPIKGRFRISNRGDRIIGFTDNFNPPRILNITTLPFPVDVDKIPTQAGSINTLNIFSAGDPPSITPTLNHTGGFIKSGAYFFSCAYIATDNTETGYFTATGPVKINDETTGSLTYDGCIANTTTSKSITLTITGVDNRYRFLNIGVISVIAGETKFVKVGQIEIVEGTFDYTFTYVGNEVTEDLLLEQLLIQSQGIYQTAKAIAVINDRLALGNLSSRPPFDYQPYANNVVIKWKIDGQYSVSFNPIVNTTNLQLGGFRAFEVYAFYIVFRYKDGSYSPAYHIPGRASIPADLQTSSLGSAQTITAKKYQLEDTCSNDGTMSFWENEAETYPQDFPDFGGEQVRHHKFPSLNYISTNAVALGFPDLATRCGRDLLPILNYEVSNVIIPAELAAQIDGWQIYYAKRDIANQTCVGQSHLNFAHQKTTNSSEYSPNTDIYYGPVNASTGLVFPIGPGIPWQKPAKSKLSLHSPDLLLNKPNIVPTYVRNEIKLNATRPTDATFVPIFQYRATVGSRIQRVHIDYTITTNTTSTPTASTSLIRKVAKGDVLYVAPHTVSGRYYNALSSEYIALDITNGTTLDIITNGIVPDDDDHSANIHEETYLSNICQLLKTVYSPFTSQDLVTSTNIIPVGTSTTSGFTKTGDSYPTVYSFMASIHQEINTSDTASDFIIPADVTHGLKYVRNYLCECNINIKMRHEGSDSNSKYFGKTTTSISLDSQLATAAIFQIWDVTKGQLTEFNTDYNVLNTFNPVFPRNTTIDTLERFPYRVILSEQNANELADSGWRTFLPNNYKDVITTKGEIVNLEAYDDVLLIHLENTLLRTIGTQTLKTSTEDVTIGSGTIFAQEPKEIFTSELGYLGNQNLFGCGVTKLGYVFFDASQGKLFVVGKTIDELSSKGLRGYTRDNFIGDPILDNPFISTGVNICYDEKYNRLLVSKKGEDSFTLSYSPDIEGFVSYHDYIPDYMFNTRSKVFSIKDLTVYLHNHTNKATYYDGVYPSYIEPIFNDGGITKYFGSINWQTELINPSITSLFHKTFTKILLYNSYQCSGEIDLIYPTNIFNSETTWNFNNFYDIVVDRSLPFMDANGLILANLSTNLAWFKQRKFTDKWIAVRLIYNNTDQNTLFLYDVSALMRKSSR